ncbi:MAG: ROK family protein [Phycisphaerae bacterium]
MSEESQFLGLDVGGTKCVAVLGSAKGKIFARGEWPSLVKRGPGAMIDDLVARGRALIASVGKVEAIGVSIGGPLNAACGIIYSPPNLPGWDNIKLRDVLAERFAMPVEKIRIQHDAAACALAEYHWGAGQESRRLIYLTCGTGFGAGLVIDGQPYYGAGGRSGEFSHIRYQADGPEAFGKIGSLEAFAAGSAISKIAMWKYPQRHWNPDGSAPTAAHISQLAEGGDAAAWEVLRINARAVGHGAAILADLLFPDCILLGSLARYLNQHWLTEVQRAFQEEALPDAAKLCQLIPAGLGAQLGDLSALVTAMT